VSSADVVAVAVHVAWPIGLAVVMSRHEVGCDRKSDRPDGKRGLALVYRSWTASCSRRRWSAESWRRVLQCATSGRAVVGNQSAVAAWPFGR